MISEALREKVDSVQKSAMAVGVIGIILCVVLGMIQHEAVSWLQFFRSYLLGYVYWLCVPLGCMALLMVHHLTGGWWGLPIRRILEAGTRTMKLMAILFIPIWLGMHKLYLWAQPDAVANDPILQAKRWWLNPTAFTVHAIVYFVLWLGIVQLLNSWSAEQDRTGNPDLKDRMGALSGPGLVVWALTITGAAVDWIMSLEPHWFSTIYGMLFIVIECLAALSFALFVLRNVADYEPIKDVVEPKRYNDLGSLMLAFVMLWAYLSFDQLLIIWAGNLKDEIPWYMQRAFGKWAPVAVILLILHFAVPFLLLLQRTIKQRVERLALVAALIFVMTAVDIFWIVVPSYEVYAPRIHLLDIFAVIGIGGIWIAAFAFELKKLPLLPLHDPRFEGVLAHEHGD